MGITKKRLIEGSLKFYENELNNINRGENILKARRNEIITKMDLIRLNNQGDDDKMSEYTITQYCDRCETNSPFLCSGSGRKKVCEICGYYEMVRSEAVMLQRPDFPEKIMEEDFEDDDEDNDYYDEEKEEEEELKIPEMIKKW